MNREIDNYIEMVVKANSDAFELNWNDSEIEAKQKECENEFFRLANKYGMDNLLREMGFA